MRYLKLTIAYDGTRFVGWQVQQNGVAVQQVLETAWHSVTLEQIRITASGRTDSGVHALAQVCSLATSSQLSPNRLTMALNASLPPDIRVLDVQEAAEKFHAIRDATSKTYRYQIQTGPIQDPFSRLYRWHIYRDLDTSMMVDAADRFMGTHDFSSFETLGSPRSDSIRTITGLQVDSHVSGPFQFLDIDVTANGFLYNMVRIIVGSLVDVGRGKQAPDWIDKLIAARDRSRAGDTAPPHGLFLVSVEYDDPQNEDS